MSIFTPERERELKESGGTYGVVSAGQGETIVDVVSFLTLENRSFYFVFVKDLTEIIIRELRNFYKNNPRVPAALRWVGSSVTLDDGTTCEETDDSSPIHIAAEYGDNPERYPSVLVSDVNGNINDLWLSNQVVGTIIIPNPDFVPSSASADEVDIPPLKPEFLEVGQRLQGKMEFIITLTVRDEKKPARDLIVDVLLHGLVGPLRRRWHELNLNWLPNQGTIGGDAVEDLTEGGKVHVRTVSFGLQAEWIDDFFYPAITVEDIIGERTYGSLPEV